MTWNGRRSLILLDTHIWIWSLDQPERLPAEIAELLERCDDEFALSAISLWEALMLLERGRVTTHLAPEARLRSWLKASPVDVLDLNAEIAILSRSLPFQHDDPADRFIAATAFHFRCPLITMDARLRSLPWLNVIPEAEPR